MADVNANKHGAHLLHYLGELQRVQIAARFAVDLAQNVGCFTQVEMLRVPHSYYLGRTPEVMHDFFEHRVVVFAFEQTDNDLRVSELVPLACKDVVREFSL